MVLIFVVYKSFNISKKYKKKIEELEEHNEKLNYFYNAAIDGILLHDEGKILLVNHALTDITNYSSDELIKLNVASIISAKPIKKEEKNPDKIYSYETIAFRKDNTSFPVEVQEKFVEYKARKVNTTVIRDLTKHKEVENALKEERIKRLSNLFDGQEIERQRLSRDLHDGLGQQLIALKLKLESTVNASFERTINTINEVKTLFDGLINEIRQISSDLMPPVLKDFELEVVLKNLCENISKGAKINISFESNGNFSLLDKKSKIYLYRISQEAMSNIVKYSQATSASVYLLESNEFIQLIIEDNGKGFKFDENFKSRGNGIFNMRERINLLNGKFNLTSSINKGTILTIKIPLTTDKVWKQ
ncbi:MAG: PAS domain-containing sensor histidine kinase [Bacteroidales bacterium]